MIQYLSDRVELIQSRSWECLFMFYIGRQSLDRSSAGFTFHLIRPQTLLEITHAVLQSLVLLEARFHLIHHRDVLETRRMLKPVCKNTYRGDYIIHSVCFSRYIHGHFVCYGWYKLIRSPPCLTCFLFCFVPFCKILSAKNELMFNKSYYLYYYYFIYKT